MATPLDQKIKEIEKRMKALEATNAEQKKRLSEMTKETQKVNWLIDRLKGFEDFVKKLEAKLADTDKAPSPAKQLEQMKSEIDKYFDKAAADREAWLKKMADQESRRILDKFDERAKNIIQSIGR